MIQIIYVSKATRHFSLRELQVMLSAGRKRNKARGITGIVVYHQGQFLQILEGYAPVVEKLFETISTDQRHKQIELLLRTDIEERSFTDSTMGLCHISADDEEMFPGLIEFEDITHPFENSNNRAHEILLKFREGAWHYP